MPIDFKLSESQKALQAGARAFAAEVLRKVAPTIAPIAKPDERFYATRPFYQAMVDAGLVKALLPQSFGGTALSTLDFSLAAEELTAADVNVPTALLGTGLGLHAVLHHGTDAQKQRFLPDFVEGGSRLAALAFTEVTGGANYDHPDPSVGVADIRPPRRRRIGHQRRQALHHQRHRVGRQGRAPVQRHLPHRSGPFSAGVAGDHHGARRHPDIEIVSILDTVGHRATISPRIHFNNVRVPVANIVGRPGDGIAMVEGAFAWTAALIGAACVGVMRAAFDIALKFAHSDRRSGTVPVIEHQNVGFMLADIKMRIEAARYLTWKSCHQLDLTDGRSRELAIITKTYCSELCVQVVYDAMRVVGVDAHTNLYPLTGLMQDALCFPLYDGGNMGVRRRQLHTLLRSKEYDAMASAEARG
jgi:alkylation response protein AidB-like acyl-CoA dehydrogenase